MLGDVGIIGLCILKMKNEARCSLADIINKSTIDAGFKLVWFTYFEETNCVPEVSATFGVLDKSFIDGLIVCAEDDIENVRIAETIVKQATDTGIPVVTIGIKNPLCDSFLNKDISVGAVEAVKCLTDKLPHIERVPLSRLEPIEDDDHKVTTPEEISLGEDKIYSYVNKMLEARSVKDLISPIAEVLPKNAFFCFNGDFLKQYDDPDWDDEKYKVVPSAGSSVYETLAVSKTKVLPEGHKWIYSQDCFILTPAISKDVVCGYYAYRIHDMDYFKYRCRSVARFMNIALNAFVKNMQNRHILKNMEGYLFLDINTGLPNLKGVSKWFKEISAKEENHQKKFSFTVFSLPKYTYIYENYGAEAIEDAIRIVAARLQVVYGNTSYIAKVQSDEFVVITSYEKDENVETSVKEKLRKFFEELQKYHTRNLLEYFIDVNSGYAIADEGWTGTLELFIKYAANDMYLHNLNQEKGRFSKDEDDENNIYSAFDSLIKNNLITYHLQPIIDAKTGDIYGYEALMRSSGGISLAPLEILDIAKRHGRLDDVERLTITNILKLFNNNQYIFQNRKIFINTIPGHFLNEEDREQLTKQYGDIFDRIVFEVTEQDTITDEELADIRGMGCGSDGSQIAVDDYGTGHSNIVNLLRYSPQVIKIDRYLIADIQNDTNKQMFVKSTIEFAMMNNIKVLAEGVETFEEMQTVIEYGVDLIQGYYIARPSADILDRIPDRIRREVLNENLRISSYNRDLKVYRATAGETISLINLAMKQYTYIELESGKYYISGDKNSITDMHITTTDDSEVDITFIDVNMRGATETPLKLGRNSKLILRVSGINTLNKEGICVPESSSLEIVGDGTLIINLSRNYGVGIGGGYKASYGGITIDMTGCIDMSCSGDRVVCIGGEKSSQPINIISGNIVINGTGIAILDIGSVDGEAKINIFKSAKLELLSNGNDSVAMGAMKAKADILIEGNVTAEADGERTVAIGSLFGEELNVTFDNATCNAIVRCDSGSVIGTYNGTGKVTFKDSNLDIYGEGGKVTGIGSVSGQCTVNAESGDVKVKVLSGIASVLGTRRDTINAVDGVITVIANEEE